MIIRLFGVARKVIEEFFLRREDIVESGNADEEAILSLVTDILEDSDNPLEKVNLALRALEILKRNPTAENTVEDYENSEAILLRGRSRFGPMRKAIMNFVICLGVGELHKLQSAPCPRAKELAKRWNEDVRKYNDYHTHEDPELILDEIEAIITYDLALVSHIAQCDEHDDESPIELLLDPPQELKQAYDLYYEFTSTRLFAREFSEGESAPHE